MNLIKRTKSIVRAFVAAQPTYEINGFDVSEGVGVVNWEAVRTSEEFNFCSFRACLGKNPDAQWANNVAGVNSIEGYPWYPYFVPKFGNWEGETDYFLEMYFKAGGSPMPPEIDVEYNYHNLNKGQTLSWLTRSYNRIKQETGFERLFIYSNKSYWDRRVATDDYLRRFALKEVAQWNTWISEPDLIPDQWPEWDIWQWWHKLKRPEIAPGSIDGKRYHFDEARFLKDYHVLPYYAPVIEPPPPNPDPHLPGFYMQVVQEGLRIRSAPNTSAEILGNLSDGDIIKVENIGGNNCWILHITPGKPIGWSNVQLGSDVNMVKYIYE